MPQTVLYDYWRSSASYRVRIALALKGIAYDKSAVDLLAAAQKSPEHLERNPQGLVPSLEIDGHNLSQSIAIIEYLDETRPEPRLIPDNPLDRHRVRSLSYAIAMEIHPICNTGVANHVGQLTKGGEESKRAWMHHFIGNGLSAFEKMLNNPSTGRYCHGDQPTMADCCLVPQLYNARRFDVPLDGYRRLLAIDDSCRQHPAFQTAHPDAVGPPGGQAAQ